MSSTEWASKRPQLSLLRGLLDSRQDLHVRRIGQGHSWQEHGNARRTGPLSRLLCKGDESPKDAAAKEYDERTRDGEFGLGQVSFAEEVENMGEACLRRVWDVYDEPKPEAEAG